MWKWLLWIFIIAAAIRFWPITLALVVLLLLGAYMGRNKAAGPRPLKPARKQAPKPKPAAELQAPEYLPRWTASRHMNNGREHAQWQREFDRS